MSSAVMEAASAVPFWEKRKDISYVDVKWLQDACFPKYVSCEIGANKKYTQNENVFIRIMINTYVAN